MQKSRRIIHLILVTTVGAILALFNPYFAIFLLLGTIVFLAIIRQLNTLKIAMAIKRYTSSISKLRGKIRAHVHTGFRDFSGNMENEESRRKSYSYLR